MKLKFLRTVGSLLLALILLFTLACCGKSEDGEQIPENMKYATVEGSYYRLFVPSDWNLMTETGVSGAYASLQSTAVIYVRDYENPSSLSVKDFVQQTHTATLTAAFPADDALSVSEPKKTLLNGKEAYSVDYTGTRQLVTYQGRDIVCGHNDRIYVLTFCTQKDVYEAYSSVYDSVVSSFLFRDTPYAPKDSVNTVDSQADAPDGMMLASNDDVAYRFYVPEYWILDRALPTSSAYASESDRSNVNVTVYMPEVDQITAEQYWAMCEAELKTVMQDMTLISTTPTTLDGRPANTYIYTATLNGTAYRFAQTIAAYRGMAYTITYTALDAAFKDHLQEYEQILTAFDFRGNN